VLGVLVVGAIGLGMLVLFALLLTGTLRTYSIPSSAMEPTLHCARPATGCEASRRDRIAVLTHFVGYERGDIVAFETPPKALTVCGSGGTFVKRIVGLPGERIELRLEEGLEYVYVDGRRLEEPYLEPERRVAGFGEAKAFNVARDHVFVMGDNRGQSCDSRHWGPLPRAKIVGEVVLTYWPPNRISFR
jgi:signal peptidase I